jgi:hypothetical protein
MGQPDPKTPCDEIQILLRRFLAKGLGPADSTRLRDHAQDCEPCQASYQEAVRTIACIGHERRVERDESVKAVRRWNLRRNMFEAHGTPRGRAARLRTLLYPAFFSFLMIQLGVMGGADDGPELTLQVLGGTVHAAEVLERGGLCATGPDGRARLEAGEDGAAELAPETRVLVERLDPPRLRLLNGDLELEGSWLVTSALGVIEVKQGRASVTLGDHGLVVSDAEGDVRYVGALGEVELLPGQPLHVEGMGEPAAQRPAPRGSGSKSSEPGR